MRTIQKLQILVLVMLLGATSAFAGPRIGVVGVVPFYNVDTPGNMSPKLSFGGGALFGLPVGGMAEVEIGALYVMRKHGSETFGVESSLTYNFIELPILMRFWFSHFLSLGAGGYLGMAMGDVKANVGGVSATSTYEASNLNKMDYGLTASLGFNIPLGTSMGFIVDGRYNFGLKELAKGGTGTKTREIEGLVGFRFGMGK